MVIILVGMMLGLGLGGGLGVLIDSSDRSFHAARDLQQRLRIPVLAEIPAILLDADRVQGRRRRLRMALAAASVVFLVLLGSGGGYLYVNVLPGWRAARDAGAGALPAKPPPRPAAPAAPAAED
jgi:hypothetical protein